MWTQEAEVLVLWQGGYLGLCPMSSELLGSSTFWKVERVMGTAAGEADIGQLVLVEVTAP